MLTVELTRENFEYDMNALLKSFYPSEEVKMKGIEAEEGLFRVRVLRNGEILSELTMSDDYDRNKSEFKNEVRRSLYKKLVAINGHSLPWGILNGIRPTKLVMHELIRGKTDKEAKAFMENTYLASGEKAELAVKIANNERAVIERSMGREGWSLYIGIPFCPTTCMYCSFTSYAISRWKKRVGEYLEALFREIDAAAEIMHGQNPDTIYIGGGTPTSLEAEELELLFSKLEEIFDMNSLLEFTVEAGRADSISEEKLRVLKKHGVTRISVNPQTMNDKTLELIGRRHTVVQVENAFLMARDLGFDNINMDIILGLPGENDEEVTRTLERIEKLKPDNLTVHSLASKRASKLAKMIDEMGYERLHNTDSTMRIASASAKRMGMHPYYLYRQKNMSGNFENTGYAIPGKEGIYNILIMEEIQSIIAAGAGTVSKRVVSDGTINGKINGKINRTIKRCDTAKDVDLYIRNIDEMILRKKRLFGN